MTLMVSYYTWHVRKCSHVCDSDWNHSWITLGSTRDTDTSYWPAYSNYHPTTRYRLARDTLYCGTIFKSRGYKFNALRRDDPRVPSRYNRPYPVRMYVLHACRQVKVTGLEAACSRLHNDMVWALGTCLTRSSLPSASFPSLGLSFLSVLGSARSSILIFGGEKELYDLAAASSESLHFERMRLPRAIIIIKIIKDFVKIDCFLKTFVSSQWN